MITKRSLGFEAFPVHKSGTERELEFRRRYHRHIFYADRQPVLHGGKVCDACAVHSCVRKSFPPRRRDAPERRPRAKTTALRLERQHGPQSQSAVAGIQIGVPLLTLRRHDKTISSLNKFEDIRYPDPIKVPSMGVSADWSGPAGTMTTYGGLRTPKQYELVVSPIDDLVADIFRASSWSPPHFMGTNLAALEAVTRHNAHSEFLTKRP